MVKLIKVNAPTLIEDKARFTIFFQEDIQVNENARIALRNIQMSPDPTIIVGEGCGMDISLYRNANNTLNNVRVSIPAGEYSQLELEEVIFNTLNSSFLQTDCAVSGRAPLLNRVQFQTTSSSGKFDISCKFTADQYNSGLSANANIAYDATTQRYTKTANNNNWDYIKSIIPMCRGTGTIACNILNNSGSLDGCAIGFYGITQTPLFTIFTENGFYKYIDNNNDPVQTIFAVQNNDRVELMIQQGRAKLKITRNNGTVVNTTVEKLLPTSYDGHSYAFLALKTTQSCLREFTWTQDPFLTNVDGVIKKADTEYIYSSNLSDASPQTVDITFLQAMNRFLGYEKISYSQTGVSLSFIAEKAFSSTKIPDGFYIVLDNMKLDSYDYDGTDSVGIGRRKNVLANITEYTLATTHNLITYETDDPIYIDISNKNKFSLNSITFSIYDQENNLLKCQSPLNVSTTGRNLVKLTLLLQD